ncbi:MAG: 2-succinyl-5-enolpyruvyl-6-hydroxy-3-cyclohexene-1-carboxylic-acid synthase [Burkholderiaceae bacterium]
MPENLLTEWSRLLFDSLAAAGVTDVVASPGSRNTPFVLAAAHQPGLRVTDVIDERAAAFFALGQARVTGRPSVLVCTSGSAGAHYLPAVIEADAAGIPLLILTADRPIELIHVGANQAIDQAPLLAGYVRRVVDVGAPDATPSSLRGLRRLAAQAVALSRAPRPGPVHLNLRARKPLEPTAATSSAGQALSEAVAALCHQPITAVFEPRLTLDNAAIEALADRLGAARRGVIVAGPAPAEQGQARAAVAALAAASGFALLPEAASQLRFTGDADAAVTGFDWIYRLPAGETDLRPDCILQIGAPPTSGAWERWVERHPEIERIVLAPSGWPDPHNSAAAIVHADLADTCERLTAELRRRAAPASHDFKNALTRAEQTVRSTIAADPALAPGGWSEAAVAQTVCATLPADSWLMLGNSLPLRSVDAYCHGPAPRLRVLTQRGASGIDGLVSGAAGTASAATEPVALLVGDVSLLHDIGGLMLAAAAQRSLVIVVVNNGGGRIFEQLPIARADHADELHHFTTPHAVEIEHAARLYRMSYARVGSRGDLAAAIQAALGHRSGSLIEAVVPPHGAAEVQSRVLAALASDGR